MLLSDTIVDFHLFYDEDVDIQIWPLLTKSQCKVSDTQVTIKACGPLVDKRHLTLTIRMHDTLWKKASNACMIPLCIMLCLRIFWSFFYQQNRLAEKRIELLGLLSQLMSEQESRREELRKRLVTNYTALLQTHFLAHHSQRLKWAFLIKICPLTVVVVVVVVNFSPFHLLLQNHWANFNQTWHKASLGDGDSSLFKWRAPSFSKGR